MVLFDIFCSSPDKISKNILVKSSNDIFMGILISTESISGDAFSFNVGGMNVIV